MKPPKVTREQAASIVRRYLKPESEQPIVWAREMASFYRLWKVYPSLAFWTHHELDFLLNHLSYFETESGAIHLKADWDVFHYVPSEPVYIPSEPVPLDANTQSNYTVSKPRSIAQYLTHG